MERGGGRSGSRPVRNLSQIRRPTLAFPTNGLEIFPARCRHLDPPCPAAAPGRDWSGDRSRVESRSRVRRMETEIEPGRRRSTAARPARDRNPYEGTSDAHAETADRPGGARRPAPGLRRHRPDGPRRAARRRASRPTGWRRRPARTCSCTPTTRSTGIPGAPRRSPRRRPRTSRSSCRSATARATGATSWSARASRTPRSPGSSTRISSASRSTARSGPTSTRST